MFPEYCKCYLHVYFRYNGRIVYHSLVFTRDVLLGDLFEYQKNLAGKSRAVVNLLLSRSSSVITRHVRLHFCYVAIHRVTYRGNRVRRAKRINHCLSMTPFGFLRGRLRSSRACMVFGFGRCVYTSLSDDKLRRRNCTRREIPQRDSFRHFLARTNSIFSHFTIRPLAVLLSHQEASPSKSDTLMFLLLFCNF